MYYGHLRFQSWYDTNPQSSLNTDVVERVSLRVPWEGQYLLLQPPILMLRAYYLTEIRIWLYLNSIPWQDATICKICGSHFLNATLSLPSALCSRTINLVHTNNFKSVLATWTWTQINKVKWRIKHLFYSVHFLLQMIWYTQLTRYSFRRQE